MLILASTLSLVASEGAMTQAASTTDVGSDNNPAFVELELPSMCHKIAVESFDPVTSVLPSGESPRQVIGAQCPDAVSMTRALSVAITFKRLSACPPTMEKDKKLKIKR